MENEKAPQSVPLIRYHLEDLFQVLNLVSRHKYFLRSLRKRAKYEWVVSRNDIWWGDYVMLKGTPPLTNL